MTTRILVRLSPNLMLIFAFSCPTLVPNFSPIKACVPELEQFCVCVKKRNRRRIRREREKRNFIYLYLRNGWHDLLQAWNVASRYRWAPPQQI